MTTSWQSAGAIFTFFSGHQASAAMGKSAQTHGTYWRSEYQYPPPPPTQTNEAGHDRNIYWLHNIVVIIILRVLFQDI